jgi:tRNA modification GTPase
VVCRTRPPPRRASLRSLYDRDDAVIDRALVLWMPGPSSFTGEDCAELHVHGSRAVLSDLADRLVGIGLRPAEPGEFTRRAFLNDRLDLVEAEGLADLIDAETTLQRRQALRQLEGGLGRLLADWSTVLTEALAHQEALIDFPDEDLPPGVEEGLRLRLHHLAAAMRRHIDDERRGERLRDGLVFAILGAPNAGKSTLMNAVARREIAIVAPTPGTTRDVLEARIDLGGVPVTFLDTAGIRSTDDPIEAEGVRRSLGTAGKADALIIVQSPWEPAPADLPEHDQVIHVWTKADVAGADGVSGRDDRTVTVSALTGQGMDELAGSLGQLAQHLTVSEGPPPLTRARHRAALQDAVEALERAPFAALPELSAEDLRLALRALGRITGRVGVEDILDTLFRQFCIGK